MASMTLTNETTTRLFPPRFSLNLCVKMQTIKRPPLCASLRQLQLLWTQGCGVHFQRLEAQHEDTLPEPGHSKGTGEAGWAGTACRQIRTKQCWAIKAHGKKHWRWCGTFKNIVGFAFEISSQKTEVEKIKSHFSQVCALKWWLFCFCHPQLSCQNICVKSSVQRLPLNGEKDASTTLPGVPHPFCNLSGSSPPSPRAETLSS